MKSKLNDYFTDSELESPESFQLALDEKFSEVEGRLSASQRALVDFTSDADCMGFIMSPEMRNTMASSFLDTESPNSIGAGLNAICNLVEEVTGKRFPWPVALAYMITCALDLVHSLEEEQQKGTDAHIAALGVSWSRVPPERVNALLMARQHMHHLRRTHKQTAH